MNQQLAYKLLAAFLVITMLGSVFAYIFIGDRDQTSQETQQQDESQEIFDEDLWFVDHPFFSLSDALNMTPDGAIFAVFMDLENMPPQMIQMVRQDPLLKEVDSIYKSNATKMFYARIEEGENENKSETFLLLSTMSIPRNDFEYMVEPNSQIPILIRQEKELNGIYNILGYPIILAPPSTAINVLNILYGQNMTNTSYDIYRDLINNAETAPFQEINSNVSYATAFYRGIGLVNGSYERTTVYLDANAGTLKKLDQLQANATQKGFSKYDIAKAGNYTIVRIDSSELFKVITEDTS